MEPASAAPAPGSGAPARRALVLFAHGARAASWADPFERLRDLTANRSPGVIVRLAFLELMSPQLPELVAELAQQGVEELTVIPVFLGQGGHVLRDLPLLIDRLRIQFPSMSIGAVKAIGEDPSVLEAMAAYCASAGNR